MRVEPRWTSTNGSGEHCSALTPAGPWSWCGCSSGWSPGSLATILEYQFESLFVHCWKFNIYQSNSKNTEILCTGCPHWIRYWRGTKWQKLSSRGRMTWIENMWFCFMFELFMFWTLINYPRGLKMPLFVTIIQTLISSNLDTESQKLVRIQALKI